MELKPLDELFEYVTPTGEHIKKHIKTYTYVKNKQIHIRAFEVDEQGKETLLDDFVAPNELAEIIKKSDTK